MIYINRTGKQNQVWLPKPYDIVIDDCPEAQDAWNSGYTSGNTDGYADGWETGYTSGYTDGKNSCSGGSCEEAWEEGYDSGYTDGAASVDCTEFYNSGKTDGIAEQKAKLISTSITVNGTYTREDGYNSISVNVPSDSGTGYDSGYTEGYQSGVTDGYDSGMTDGWAAGYPSGYTDGVASVDCTEFYNSGYTSGKTDGVAEQKSKLVATAITSNGTYAREDGFNSINVNIPSDSGTGYESGYTDGYQSGYTDGNEDGFETGYNSGVTDGFAAGYDSGTTDGYAEGEAHQKSLLISSSFTVNGTYTRENGWSSITINVSGYSQEDLDAAYASGYTNGYSSGYTDGLDACVCPATAITLNIPEKIIISGETSLTVEPQGYDVDPSYTTSDPNLATIDSNGKITARGEGEVTICVTDNYTLLQDCKTVFVTIYEKPVSVSGDVTMWYFRKETETPAEYTLSTDTFLGTLEEMYIDGELVQPVSSITFSPGYHVVDYFISNEYSKILNSAFIDSRNISTEVHPRTNVHSAFTVDYNAFSRNHNLSSITISDRVTSLGRSCFAGCEKLTGVVIPDSVTEIPAYCFDSCSGITNVTIGSGVTFIGENAFANCQSLQEIDIPDNVTHLYKECFVSCFDLVRANIGSGVTYAERDLFGGCIHLSSVTFNNNLGGSIPDGMFYSCSRLVDCTIPSGITSIGADSFALTHLTDITVPEGVTNLGGGAFANCEYALHINLPSTLSSIGRECFVGETLLIDITIDATTPPTLQVTSGSLASLGLPGVPIYVPASAVNTYKSNTDYQIYWNYIQAIPE